MPQSLYWYAAAAMGGKIYATGGRNEEGDMLDSVFVYDPQADAWTPLASMSTSRSGHASAAVGGKLYVFGGYGAEGNLSTAEVYDPALDSWAQVPNLTCARSNVAAAAL
eukprot:scaffold5888_cov62-Phaeocystis_antarctica.AAC.7